MLRFTSVIFVILLLFGPGLHGDDTPTDVEETVTNISVNIAQLSNESIASTTKKVPDTIQPTTAASDLVNDTATTPKPKELPAHGLQEAEHQHSMSIFVILLVVVICIFIIHAILITKFHYLPESIAAVLLGAIIGFGLNMFDVHVHEAFPPELFFLVLLPPIIFESGYNLHKGNFFQNFGTIIVFAVIGTMISALVVGGGIYLLGQMNIIYKLNFVPSFAFGALISAVDPVATLAIFHALDVDEVLYMLVFGESILNDAVSIVLTTTVLAMAQHPDMSGLEHTGHFIKTFLFMFVCSALIGVFFALLSAILLKLVDLRKTPSLEIGMILIFSYLPYGLCEGLHFSGIMAILSCGIVMSHYTHYNLSPIAQITVQHAYRTIAFIAETVIFVFLGLAISSYHHVIHIELIVWAIILILLGRAVNIFPLSALCNVFRGHKITKKMQFISWFSGLRGAVAFALSLFLDFTDEIRHVIVSTTLVVVLFTILFLGGSTLPLLKFLDAKEKRDRRMAMAQGLPMSSVNGERGNVDGDEAAALALRRVKISKTAEYGDLHDENDGWRSAARVWRDLRRRAAKTVTLIVRPYFADRPAVTGRRRRTDTANSDGDGVTDDNAPLIAVTTTTPSDSTANAIQHNNQRMTVVGGAGNNRRKKQKRSTTTSSGGMTSGGKEAESEGSAESWFASMDERYLRPLFVRRLNAAELAEARQQVTRMAADWSSSVNVSNQVGIGAGRNTAARDDQRALASHVNDVFEGGSEVGGGQAEVDGILAGHHVTQCSMTSSSTCARRGVDSSATTTFTGTFDTSAASEDISDPTVCWHPASACRGHHHSNLNAASTPARVTVGGVDNPITANGQKPSAAPSFNLISMTPTTPQNDNNPSFGGMRPSSSFTASPIVPPTSTLHVSSSSGSMSRPKGGVPRPAGKKDASFKGD